jgi:hypothetical protein
MASGKRHRSSLAASCCLAGAALLLGGCPPTPVAKLNPSLRDALGPLWTLVPEPNGGLLPGAVVQLTPTDGKPLTPTSPVDITPYGTLQDCTVPADALKVTDASVPGMTQGSTYSVDASLGASLAHLPLPSVGANASSTADFTIKAASDQSLDFITLTNWVSDPANAAAVNKNCSKVFALPNMFVVREAFVISDGSYDFKDDRGVKIDVTVPVHVPVNGKLGVSNGDSGGLTISAPTVFALKLLQPVPEGGFAPMVYPVAGVAAPVKGHSVHHAVAPAAPPPPPPPPPLLAQPFGLGGVTITGVKGAEQ